MDSIRIDVSAGPEGRESEVSTSLYFNVDKVNDNIITNALNKAIKKIKIENKVIIVALMDVFVNGKRTHEVGILGANGKIMINEIKKI